MGLLLSILVGCVGVLELLSSLKQVSNEVSTSSTGPTTPCLSYHEPSTEIPSFHDSLCSITHSGDIPVSGSVKRKLENLHEYSLRVRSELKSAGGSDWGTLSDCSTRDLLSPSRTDSRHSLANLDPSIANNDEDEAWRTLLSVLPTHQTTAIFIEDDRTNDSNDRVTIEEINDRVDREVEDFTAKGLIPDKTVNEYIRVPTPIPLGISQEISRSNSSLSSSLDIESGNEAPTRTSFDQITGILTGYENEKSSSSAESSIVKEDDLSSRVRKRGFIRISRSRSPDLRQQHSLSQEQIFIKSAPKLLLNEVNMEQDFQQGAGKVYSETKTSETQVDGAQAKTSECSQRRCRTDKTKGTSTVLRKPTRLKSKNAEISKSAENLAIAKGKRTKRQREPERRKSDISVQTMKQADSLRDEWTNTSPTNSEASIGGSRTSVSVQVQTSFDDKSPNDSLSFGIPVIGLSESRRDIGIKDRDHFGRRTFRNRRFPTSIAPKSRSLDDYTNSHWVASDVEGFGASNDTNRDNDKRLEKKIGGINDTVKESKDRKFTTNEERFELREPTRFNEDESSMDEEFVDAEELIFSGEYTKAMNKDWHSGHFCCWQCDESLTGQRYVLRDEHPYCIKCYESVFANGCEECNKIIGIDSKDLSYKDKHWHEACFLCNKCRVSLVDKQFGSKVDKIYCGNCYDAQFASRCDGCGEIFRAGTKKMEYKTRQWHEKCFCCVVCRNPIGTKSFIPREQEIYCAGCYEDKFATRCVKCNKIITSGGVTYKNEPWHRDCFTCSNCNNSLAGQRFTSRDDKPYCAECFGELFAKRCTACTKPITGIGGTRFISFEDRHWHNNCFICAGCNTSLVGRGFITDGDDIICPECAKQKLSE